MPVTCTKQPPDDDELDKDSIGSEDLQLDRHQAAKLHIQRKPSKQAKQKSKPSHQRKHSKLTSSECDKGLTGECTIEILQEDKLQVVNRKQKWVKQVSLRFGPFDFDEDIDWEAFLEKITEACEATQEGLVVQSLCWKWLKPTNSSPIPLGSSAGFASFKKKLTGSQPMIILIMKPPQALGSKKPVCSLLFYKHMLH